MTHNYKSKLREKIAAFLDLKLKQGFIYKNQSILLNELDGYLVLNHPTATTITRDWALEWIAPRREAEKPGTTNKRITILRELGKFISLTEPTCYVIENNVNVRVTQPLCRIITPKEMRLLLECIPEINPQLPSPQVFQSAFRLALMLMYLTGMRSGEIRNLKRSDVLLKEKALKIRESKGHVDRKVALSEELFASIKKYLDETKDLRGDNLFTSDGKSPLTAKRFRLLLTRLWTISGLEEPAPRMADFRHSFITLRLLQWHKQGADISLKAQFLQAFVGHNRLEDTLYYFRLVPEVLSAYGGVKHER